jgi:hypothetical protein
LVNSLKTAFSTICIAAAGRYACLRQRLFTDKSMKGLDAGMNLFGKYTVIDGEPAYW